MATSIVGTSSTATSIMGELRSEYYRDGYYGYLPVYSLLEYPQYELDSSSIHPSYSLRCAYQKRL